jgi:hypothetical protein
VLCVIEMLETADFFEERIKECRSSAAQSTNKNDREFWLKMAVRWEGLLKTRQSGDEPARRPDRFRRSIFRRSMLLARQAAKRRTAA